MASLGLLFSCGGQLGPGEVSLQGEQLSLPAQSLDLRLAGAWSTTANPADFSSGLEGVVFEAAHPSSGAVLAATWHGMPDGSWGTPPLDSALDRLVWLAPQPKDGIPSRTARIARCDGAIERTVGEEGPVVQVAQSLPEGLLLWHAWGAETDSMKQTLRRLVCDSASGSP